VALQDHAERIADQQRVNTGIIKQARERRVITGQDGDFLAIPPHFAKSVQGDGLAATHFAIVIQTTGKRIQPI